MPPELAPAEPAPAKAGGGGMAAACLRNQGDSRLDLRQPSPEFPKESVARWNSFQQNGIAWADKILEMICHSLLQQAGFHVARLL